MKTSFLIKINPEIDHKEHFKDLIKFQINRLNHFFKGTLIFYDPNQLIKKHKIKINSKYIVFQNFLDITDFFENDDIIFLIESLNPLIDPKNISDMCKEIEETDTIIKIEGAVPGTVPNCAVKGKFFKENIVNLSWFEINPDNCKTVYSETQRKFNNVFDLKKPIRIKIFSKLLQKITNLHKLSLTDFMKILEKDEIFELILNLGNDKIKIKKFCFCPNCKNTNLKPLYFSTSQPMIGFLPNTKASYFECLKCSLVFLKNQCNLNDLKLFYDEYERPKINESLLVESYVNGKGPSHFQEKIQSLELIESVVGEKNTIIDLGGGFGEFSCLAKSRNKTWDVTCADFNLNHVKKILSKYDVKSKNVNIINGNYGNNFDVITALHVIEHIPFESILVFLKNIYKSLKKNGFLLITTPDYDSPLSKIFNYDLMYLPFHQTVLSSTWLENYLKKNGLFKKIKQDSACILLENYKSWFDYYQKTSPTNEFSSLVQFFDSVYEKRSLFNKIHTFISKNNLGSESIMLFQKI